MTKKTWNEKLNNIKDMPKIIHLSAEAATKFKGSKMLIAPALEYDELMKQVPEGNLTTIEHVRNHLAKKHSADVTCPLTAGIFTNIVAYANEERNNQNQTPYWRTLKKDGELSIKYPGGLESHKTLLEKEGHIISKKGKRLFVTDYKNKLFELK